LRQSPVANVLYFPFSEAPLSASAVVERGMSAADSDAERRDTAFGAGLTQLLTAGVLVTMAERRTPGMCRCMTSDRSPTRFVCCWAGRSWYGRARRYDGGGAVSSLALAWGLGEIPGQRRSLALHPFEARWSTGSTVTGSAVFVACMPDVLSLNIATQALNACCCR